MSPINDDQRASQHSFDVFGLLNLVLPSECVAGVEANMELMKVHARIVEAFDLTKATHKASEE
ncbi:MAG: DUF4089 domain-containing protein [Planctomycetota bacterium]|nr:DUF4089 domain-containing protein [Planctomycetota bacterium]